MSIDHKPSIVLFSAHFAGSGLPFYITYYLEKLTRHFDQTVLLTTATELSQDAVVWLKQRSIELKQVKNEGYDFGMWYKALAELDANRFGEIALVNDSCILFRRLDDEMKRIRASAAGYIGMVASNRFSPHIQSYFLVIRGTAIPLLFRYFLEKGIVSDYRSVIWTYELGMPAFMQREGVRIQGLYNEKGIDYPENPSFALLPELLEQGLPMIKKKILFRNYRGLEYYWLLRMGFQYDPQRYIEMVRKKYTGAEIIDFDQVMNDAPKKHRRDVFWFRFVQLLWSAFLRIPGSRFFLQTITRVYRKWRPRPVDSTTEKGHQ
ncbi:MAG: hypothetical protein JNN19_12840 [Bacteroidia bacterium]|nr:hypothetical protein [Bacteroidia bacterium]